MNPALGILLKKMSKININNIDCEECWYKNMDFHGDIDNPKNIFVDKEDVITCEECRMYGE